MNPDTALTYVTYLAERLGLPLTADELWNAADRAVTKPISLVPLYAALAEAPIEGATVFRAPLPPVSPQP